MIEKTSPESEMGETATKPLKHVLIADDEPSIWRIFDHLLGPGWIIETVSDSMQALERLGKQKFQVVIADYNMPGHDGIWLLKKVKQIEPKAIRILVSGLRIESIDQYLDSGLIHHFIPKPINQDKLTEALNTAPDSNVT